MMKFGMYLENGMVELVDLETGEILTETKESTMRYLEVFEDNYTLEII